eukprot:CAMPEP_0173103572 /NCGR_PEP_ID=MMETSP1102-20130122/38475_1 /TAXON_ID=49646 /ORGANISM="Geminigera sp., Strain Caron Lab Isolate" /LENGTH=90 /DNA_ID=CAMNT_0013998423 /DNA_START=137 /DNA_END=406 /DNA_ORIENTATION=-
MTVSSAFSSGPSFARMLFFDAAACIYAVAEVASEFRRWMRDNDVPTSALAAFAQRCTSRGTFVMAARSRAASRRHTALQRCSSAHVVRMW